MVCETPDLGRIKKVGLFLLDDCMSPIYGTAAGYIDDCPAAFATSDNVDDGKEFTRKCADGSIKKFVPGVKSLQSVKVDADFHWLDPEWITLAGGATPIMHDGEVIGYADGTRDKINVLVVVWQELLGDECTDSAGNAQEYVRMYPLKGARLTEDGDVGAEDNVTRITGETVTSSDLGSGPIPLVTDTSTGDVEWVSDCFPSGQHRFRFIGAPAPDVCGSMDTEEPSEACTPAS